MDITALPVELVSYNPPDEASKKWIIEKLIDVGYEVDQSPFNDKTLDKIISNFEKRNKKKLYAIKKLNGVTTIYWAENYIGKNDVHPLNDNELDEILSLLKKGLLREYYAN